MVYLAAQEGRIGQRERRGSRRRRHIELLPKNIWGSIAHRPIGKPWRQRFGEKGKELFIQKLHDFDRVAGFCLRAHSLENPQRKTTLPPFARPDQS